MNPQSAESVYLELLVLLEDSGLVELEDLVLGEIELFKSDIVSEKLRTDLVQKVVPRKMILINF